MATIARQTQTSVPVSLGGSIPGDAATGHVLRDVRDFVENLAPQSTPILTRVMSRGRSTSRGRRGDQYKLEWGSGANLPHTAEVGSNYSSGATTLAVESGQGARFQKYMRIAIYDLDVNGLPDISTKMEAWLSAEPSTDNLTIVPAQGGTSNRDFAAGARVEIIGTAVPEGQDFTVSATAYGDFYHNFYELFAKSAIVTMEADVTANAEFGKGEMRRRQAENTQRIKLELEKALVQGGRQAGTLATPTPSFMGGIDFFVPSANTTNLAGAQIGPYDIETLGATLWESVGDAGAKSLLMNMRTARFFDGLINKYRQASMGDTSVNLQLSQFTTRVGTYNIEVTRWVPDGVVYGVNFDNLSLVAYEGMEWQEKEHATDGAYMQRSIFGKYTLMVESPETMFKLHNFNTDINAYGRTF